MRCSKAEIDFDPNLIAFSMNLAFIILTRLHLHMKLMKGTKVCIKTKSIQLQSRFHSMAGSLSTTAKQTIVQKRKSEAKHLSTENEKNLLLCALVSLETLNSIIFKFLFFRGRQINLLKFCSLTFSLSQSPPNLLQVLFFRQTDS